MSLAAKLRRAPLRLVSGAFLLNSGLAKLAGGDSTPAEGRHGMASGAYPLLGKLPPATFDKALGAAETTIGGALLTPFVPPGLAGMGLTGFAGGLVGMYWRTPGTHPPGDPRPTHTGIVLAKDTWLVGIGLSLVIDSMLSRKERKERRRQRRARKRADEE